ncbi:MAG: sugar ABC transporter permease [Bryobacterales bacterium]|nr:sugar ABC transporter permease [Bryobacterales bacterium]
MRAPRWTIGRREAVWGFVFISPWVLGFVVFSLGPTVAIIAWGFTEYDILQAPKFAGLENYIEIVTDDEKFLKSLANTAIYVGLLVPLQVVIGFLLAVLVNTKLPLASLFRAFYFLPTIMPLVVASIVWAWVLQPELGLLKFLLEDTMGIPTPRFMVDEYWSKPGIVILTVWSSIGVQMILFLAALQAVPPHLYEAAEIDGAGPLRKMLHVTIPLVSPTIFLVIIIGIINSFQVFTTAFVLTQGGPLDSTLFYVLYLWRKAFVSFEFGYASALATILFIIIMLLTAVSFWVSRRLVHYEQPES